MNQPSKKLFVIKIFVSFKNIFILTDAVDKSLDIRNSI